ncbi:DUF5999 family protein [Carbonactinospora thermoautotrophica]|uniref:DUF5999 family protein n=1 Tax=Carbonactinospora thermoautotrophica TaxID=1469144 RepID=UPI00099ED8C7
MCLHVPPCPSADAPDREAARTVACHPEQGWSLLCNGEVPQQGSALGSHRVLRAGSKDPSGK